MTGPLVAKTPSDVDVVAAEIARVAALAKAMPPAWDGAKVAHGFTGTQGENLGRVLPGRGVALASDLKSLGITKPIPHVFEKTLAMKAVEACGGRERLALGAAAMLLGAKLGALGMADALLSLPLFVGPITNYDGIINGRANGKGEDVVFWLATQTTATALGWHTPIRSTTRFPQGTFAPANIPGGTQLNRATPGSLVRGLTNPSGSDKKYLLSVGWTSSSTLNMVLLVDMLVASGGISTNVITPQTVSTPVLTRYTTGAGVLATLEVTSQLSTTAANVTITYTNQAGANSRTSPATGLTTSANTGRLVPVEVGPWIRLQADDSGVRNVESITVTAAMGGTGVLCLYLYEPLHFLPGVATNIYVERDSTLQIDGLTELVVGTDSELGFLSWLVMPNGSSTGNINTFLRTVAG